MKRILLDENVPRPLKQASQGFEVQTVVEAGWAGTKNERLLMLAEREFDVFLTAGRNLPHQQTLNTLSLGVAVLAARSTKLDDLLPLAPDIRASAESVRPGEVIFIPPASCEPSFVKRSDVEQ